jgi:hypothetical protein
MQISILMFEDSENKKSSFESLLSTMAQTELDSSINLVWRIDDAFICQDLILNTFNLILVDDDLGNGLWGNNVIDQIMEEIDTNPECSSVPIIYYSAGTSIIELKEKS